MNRILLLCLAVLVFGCQPSENTPDAPVTRDYQDLVSLFEEWREFENPPKLNEAPDYTAATFEKRWPEFRKLQARLLAMDTSGWSIPNQVDYHIVWAEMNGYDFNHNILKPWVRDPSFYKSLWMARSDVPAHEGPTHHGTTEIWTYKFPLTEETRTKLLNELGIIPTLNEQAKGNLTGNARDLWIAGIRDFHTQSANLKTIKEWNGIKGDQGLEAAIDAAITSTDDLASWLEAQSASKTGPSGLGKDNYTWYMQNVHLVPLTWEDEVMILKRELARAWSALKLEEHRNRDLPELKPVQNASEYDAMSERAARSFLNFLENDNIVTVKNYFGPALRPHFGSFTPEQKRNFFVIGRHYDQRPLFCHFYHWFELARMDLEPHMSPIRKEPLLYNIWDSRNEGVATAVEEMFMDAGMYEDDPRVREIVYIMIAQRAARGLGSLYAHANEMTMEEAGGIHSEWTPRGWMKTEKELLIFEQHLYLRQPGYGTSYITGKYLLESAMAEYAKNDEAGFQLKDFFDKLNLIGCIPMALSHWEMTGVDTEIRNITAQN